MALVYVYNLITKRKSLMGKTPAQAAGITKRRHLFSDIVAMIDANFKERRPKTRGPYKKRAAAD